MQVGAKDSGRRDRDGLLTSGKWAIVGLVALAAGLWVAGHPSSHAEAHWPLAPTLRYSAARAHLASPDAIPWSLLPPPRVPFQRTLRPGDSLATVLDDLGFETADSRAIVDAAEDLTDLRKLRSGESYTVYWDTESVAAIHLSVRDRGRLELERGDGKWSGRFEPYARRAELHSVRGTLTGLLETAIEAAGGDAVVAYAMSDVLQWDLDFNRDLQVGDTFEVLYERVFLDDRFAGPGRILALTYDSGDRRLGAYVYGEGDDYYDADGRPLQKMFLRSPMRYTRVTSGFSNRRFHPVLKTYRPHYGVDYGAPKGTPVRVTANGVVESAAWENGGGRVVKVRHANGYLTAYLHLSGFADGIRSGARVRQGEVVGYVGSTGLATAPHLDYRVRLAGRWVNPLSLPNDPAPPIPSEELEEFEDWRNALDLSLREGSPRPEVVTASRLAQSRSEG